MASSRETGKMAKVWNRLHQLFPTLVYLRSKLYHLIPVFFAVTFASFLLLNLLPGNIVDALLVDQGDFAADQETRAEIEKELGLDREKTNVNGGAIAIGHPVGASGARLTVTILHELRRRGGKYGLAGACIGGGMGLSVLVEAFPA